MSTESGSDRTISAQLRHAAADAEQVAEELIQTYLDRLAAALTTRGLQVAVRPPGITVKNPAVSASDARGAALSPGLNQQIMLRLDESRGWTWCWVWPAFRSAERDVPTPDPEVEPMCPAADIDFAADRIANVVRLTGDVLDA